MLANYERIRSQRARLGSLEGYSQGLGVTAGQANVASGFVGQIGNIITNITGMIVGGDVRKTALKEQTKIVTVQTTEGTKRLEIKVKGATEQAQIGVDMVKAKYGSITNLIVSLGGIAVAVMVVGAIGYAVVKKVGR